MARKLRLAQAQAGTWGLVPERFGRPPWEPLVTAKPCVTAPAGGNDIVTRSCAQTRICGVVVWCRGVHINRPPVGGPAGALEDELRTRKAQLGGVELLVWACVGVSGCSCRSVPNPPCGQEAPAEYVHSPSFDASRTSRQKTSECSSRPYVIGRPVT